MAHPSKSKGDRIERQLVAAHNEAGVYAERVDARIGQFSASKSHDIDIYPHGKDQPPLCGEVKARKDGVVRQSNEGDFLVLRRDRAEPMVVVPWAVWIGLVKR